MDCVSKISDGLALARKKSAKDPECRRVVDAIEDATTPYNRVQKYAWDEGKLYVNVYITVNGIIDQSCVLCQFGSTKFRVRCWAVDGKNYEMAVPNLLHAIDPEKSSFALKPNEVRLKLKKTDPELPWDALDGTTMAKLNDEAEKARAKKARANWEALDESQKAKFLESKAMAMSGASKEEVVDHMAKIVRGDTGADEGTPEPVPTPIPDPEGPVVKESDSLVRARSDPNLDPDKRKLLDAIQDSTTPYVKIDRYGWDEGKLYVTLYITLEGISEQSYVVCHFERREFHLWCLGINGAHYDLGVPNLLNSIDPEKSSFVLKRNEVRLKLKKKDPSRNWPGLDDSQRNKNQRAQAAAQESASVEQMMADMYKNVDDKTRVQLEQQLADKMTV